MMMVTSRAVVPKLGFGMINEIYQEKTTNMFTLFVHYFSPSCEIIHNLSSST